MSGNCEDTENKNGEPDKGTAEAQGKTKQFTANEDKCVSKESKKVVYVREHEDKEKTNDGQVEEGNDSPNITTFEDLLHAVGTRGRWNLLLFFFCAYATFVSPMQTLSYQFLGATPGYWCRVDPLLEAGWTQEQIFIFAIPVDEEGNRETCLMYDHNYTLAVEVGYEEAIATMQDSPALVPCNVRDFNLTQHQSTMTTEWDLVCERRALYSTTQAAAQVGKFAGALILGYLIDLYGRRKIVLWCSLFSILSGFGSALSPTVEVYIVFKIIIMAVMAGAYLGCFTLLMETSGNTERSRASALFVMPWAVGYMITPCIAYLVRPWKWMQAALSLPTLLMVLYYWFLPESPRWLILQGRHQEALQVLTAAAKCNNRTLPSNQKLLAAVQLLQKKASDEKEVTASDGEGEESKYMLAVRCVRRVVMGYLSVLRVRELRLRALVVFFCWFVSGLVYYGISLNSTSISADPYLYMFLGGVLEVPSYLLLWPTIVFLGRVKGLALLYLLCGIFISALALIIFLYPAAHIGLVIFISLSGKVAITMGFHLIWLFTMELFPTKYRSLATSQASVCARVGSVSSPYLNDLLGELVSWAPSVVFSILSFMTAGLSILLPETSGRALSEGNKFDKHSDSRGEDNLAYLTETNLQTRPTTNVEADAGRNDVKGNVTTHM